MARSHAYLDMGVAVLALTVLLFAGMLFGVAAVSVGHGNAMSEPSVDRRGPVLPADTITAGNVESLRFTMALRGYRMDEVDAVLDRLSAELSVREAEIGRLRAGADGVAPVPGSTLYDPHQAPPASSTPYGTPAYGPPAYGTPYDAPAYQPPAPYEARPQASGPEASGPETSGPETGGSERPSA